MLSLLCCMGCSDLARNKLMLEAQQTELQFQVCNRIAGLHEPRLSISWWSGLT